MERFEGYTSLRDTIRDEEIHNWIGFQVTDDSVVFMIGGTRQRTRPILVTSENPFVIRAVRRVVQVLRAEAYKQRKIVPIPKPAKPRAPQRGGKRCEKCQGTGEYEAVDGTWQDCDWCAHAERQDVP